MYKYVLLLILANLIYGQNIPYFNNEKNSIKDEDIILGVVKIEAKLHNGIIEDQLGMLVNNNTIVTSSAITRKGSLIDINIKIKDKSTNIVVCIAKAKLIANDTSLALLKLTNYTDDYCNISTKKLYHQIITTNQKIEIPKQRSPVSKSGLSKSSPFVIDNKICNMFEGMPCFDRHYNLVGISSNQTIVSIKMINNFVQYMSSKGLN